MNQFQKTRSAAPRSARTLWTAALALIAVLVVIAKLNGNESPLYSKVAIGLIVVFLLVRQLTRRSGSKGPKASEPDPLSRLNLD